MTVLIAEEKKPIDILYDLIGGEDRRNAPEGLAELYDELGEKKQWVDKFNWIVAEMFPAPTMDWEVERYIKDNWRMFFSEILGVIRD